MRFILPLIFLFFSNSVALAAPQLAAEQLSYDFGEILQGDQVEYTFRFRNAGDEILEISNVRSSCGCTAALLSSRRIAPGEMGELQAKFDSAKFQGGVTKTISLESNDPQMPELSFSIYGQIKAELVMTPERVRWGKVAADSPLESVITIVNQGKTDVVLQPAQSTSPDVNVTLSSLQLPAGSQVELQVAGSLAAGKSRLGGYIIISTNHPNVSQLRLPVAARLAE